MAKSPNPAMPRGVEREFLPAALEIMETPPSPIGRGISVTIVLFFALAIAWAVIGQVDIITTAPGKIVPLSRSKVIQPFEIGVVRAIHVQEGQAVKAGDVLIELDPTIDRADRDRYAKELAEAKLDIARLRAALSIDTDPKGAFHAPDGVAPEQVTQAMQLLISQLEAQRAKLAGLDRQIAQNQANKAAIAATIGKLTNAIPLLQQRAEMRKYLADEGLGSKLLYLQEQQDLVEHQEELTVQRARLVEAERALQNLDEQKNQAVAEYRRTNYSDLQQAEQKAGDLQQDLIKAQEHSALQTLTAPVDGTVQQLAVHTLGGVVTPAQQLMVVVPEGGGLEIEAAVSNKDIGFVRTGQSAEIKVDTFNFTKYGMLHGEVLSVSQDAVVREKPTDKSGDKQVGAESDTSEPAGQELVYTARISLDKTHMQIDDDLVALTPGMAVTAEIKTGKRRVISYLLSPLVRYKHGALRER